MMEKKMSEEDRKKARRLSIEARLREADRVAAPQLQTLIEAEASDDPEAYLQAHRTVEPKKD